MTKPRSRTEDGDTQSEPAERPPVNESPQLNLYEIHSERTVLTESGNTDGWIATDMTVTPPE